MVNKKIRLIELFAGIGSQAMALRDIGANFERYKVVEFDKFAMKSYNAIHKTKFECVDIRDIDDSFLEINELDKYFYILTYSFPCTDISGCGKKAGYDEGSKTRSSLLWEVKRILKECKNLPQMLLMENVTMVHSKTNIKNFNIWLDFLKSIGYNNYVFDMNAKNFGLPQSRDRCFVVSLLSNKKYEIPKEYPLNKDIVDILESSVDNKYYFKNDRAKDLIERVVKENKTFSLKNNKIGVDLCTIQAKIKNICSCVTTKYNGGICKRKNERTGILEFYEVNENCSDNVYCIDNKKYNILVRRLTPHEIFNLMGFNDDDYNSIKGIVSDYQTYIQAGNSIAKNCLVEIFKNIVFKGELFE